MNLRDYDYVLPPDLIAQKPPPRRQDARLLVIRRSGGSEHRQITDLADFLHPGDLLVLNDTRVVPARLTLHRSTGGKVETLLVRKTEGRRWEVLMKGHRLKVGDRLEVEKGLAATLTGKAPSGNWVVEFDDEIDAALHRIGHAPLPPYIKRIDGPTPEDLERYQTVYAAQPGAIAAPTAGLHFTPELLAAIEKKGVNVSRLTLHVGTGTFLPVKNLDDHRMEPERYEIPAETLAAIERVKAAKGRVVAVGTTSCRTLETWARTRSPGGATDLFIRPPFDFQVVDALLTNFHVPQSTLLMLVSAFAGRERILAAYADAVERRYRFFSYGDAMLIL